MKCLSYNDEVFICLFYMKIIASVINLHQDHGPCYLHLPIFFLYIYSPVLLFCCKIKGSCEGFHKLRARLRPWTWGARKRRYAYMKIHARYWFLSVKIIWICQFAFFFFVFFCPVLGWFYHVLLRVRAINCGNCQLSTGAINMPCQRNKWACSVKKNVLNFLIKIPKLIIY